MKTLWVNTNFMHPTTKGGQIRTLEMLRQLHRRHEIHYVAIEKPSEPEGPARAAEYSFRAYPVQHRIRPRSSPLFWSALVKGLLSPVPVAVARFHPPQMRAFLEGLIRKEGFDCAVVDHLAPSAYFPDLPHAILFQHNVETVIWRRHVEHAADPLRRWYLRIQAERMFQYERRMSLAAGHIVAVSETDAAEMRRLFGVTRVSEVPTGVNIDYFRPPEKRAGEGADLVFVGSMDWLPNVDGMVYFVREVLPLIRRKRPGCTLAVVGRTPPPKIRELAAADSAIRVTGTVPDIRPYLWDSAVAIVPLRIGGGTRLKIYEAMAAKIPVVSTTLGAEGLTVNPPADIRIADTPRDFADRCLELLASAEDRGRVAEAAWEMVNANFSWEQVARCFERIMESGPRMR
ncbi:MAG TPA: glycosyltransferase [Candidatus Acidoferrales bacterium]|nr:glycosyltransferase [Candidatus Acidoferrales bacterium]